MRPLKTFIIYARKDESFKDDLLLHLKGTLIETRHLEVWQDGAILPGEEWEKAIEKQLEAAEIFLVLLSIHSLTSEFIRKKELVKALEKKSRIVPILVRNCFWQNDPVFAGLQGLPKNMKPVASFADQDDAWTEVMEKLHEMVEAIRAEKKPAPTASVATPTKPPQPQSAPTARHDTQTAMLANPTARHDTQTAMLAKSSVTSPPPGLPDMIPVKGGPFTMGSPKNEEGRFDRETQHPVTLSDFLIGKYPVTQRLWKEIMGNNPSHFKGDDLPVEQVSWDDVQEFLKKLNARYPGHHFRLPTEAEWEYAARGGNLSKGFIYAGSNKLDEVAWYSGNSGSKTHPVGQKKANELGLFDMSGNVWEWCADWYGDYPSQPQADPTGPESGSDRVYRGGSWNGDPRGCRVACRNYRLPDVRGNSLGFRLAASPQ